MLQYCFCFTFYFFFGWEACGILALQPGIEPAPPALEGEVLTTGPPGKSLYNFFKNLFQGYCYTYIWKFGFIFSTCLKQLFDTGQNILFAPNYLIIFHLF